MSAEWRNSSKLVPTLTERERRVQTFGESPLEHSFADVSVMCDREGNFELYITRGSKKKLDGKKWHVQRLNVTLSAEAWQHLLTAPSLEEAA